jgi:hypothetical protein
VISSDGEPKMIAAKAGVALRMVEQIHQFLVARPT